MSVIYLTGEAIENAHAGGLPTDLDWRAHALTKLQRYGMQVVNPIECAWSEPQLEPGSLDHRVRRALDLIDQCDALLANLTPPSYGTAMEIFYGYRRGKMVTVVGQSPLSPWVLSHSQAHFGDIENALDYLIGERLKPDTLSLSLQYERQLADRYEQLPPPGEPDYRFIGGELPILVVAPHATGYFRDGEFQDADTFTGSMAASLQRLTGCHALMSSFCTVADPLKHIETPMVRALSDITKSGQIGLVIMLVGHVWHESSGISIESYGPATSMPAGASADDLATVLRLKLSALEPVADCSELSGDLQPTVNFITTVLGTPVLVVRTHRRYRMPKLQPEPYVQMLSLLGDFILDSGRDLFGSRA